MCTNVRIIHLFHYYNNFCRLRRFTFIESATDEKGKKGEQQATFPRFSSRPKVLYISSFRYSLDMQVCLSPTLFPLSLSFLHLSLLLLPPPCLFCVRACVCVCMWYACVMCICVCMRVCVYACVCACHAMRLNVKGLLKARGKNAGITEQVEKKKIREGGSGNSGKVKTKGKNEAYIYRDRPMILRRREHTHAHIKRRILLQCHRRPTRLLIG